MTRFLVRKEKRISDLKMEFRNLRTVLKGIIETMEERGMAIHAWVAVGTIILDDKITEPLAVLEKERVLRLSSGPFTGTSLMQMIGKDILMKIVFENVRDLESELAAARKR
jgi:hypothetical protein